MSIPAKAILMYHSVTGKTPAVPGSFPVSLARFRHQIESLLQRGWRNAPLSRLRDPVDGPTFYITSDDGTVDWSRNVLPWCEQRGIYTHTAVVTGPWEPSPRYPLAHLIQVVLVSRSRESLRMLAEEINGRLSVPQRNYVARVYRYEKDPVRRTIKGGCNLILSEHEAKRLLQPLSERELEMLAGRFEKPAYYKRFSFAEVGAHTVSHRTLDRHTERYVEEEIAPCLHHLRREGLTPSPYFTNPMQPAPGAAVEDLTTFLRRMGFSGTLTCGGEWDQHSFVIPRIDAQQIERHLGLEEYPE